METTPACAGNGTGVGFVFLGEDGEASVVRCAIDLRQRWMLEVHLPEVELGGRHGRRVDN